MKPFRSRVVHCYVCKETGHNQKTCPKVSPDGARRRERRNQRARELLARDAATAAAKPAVVEVAGCGVCPFVDHGFDSCTHPDAPDGGELMVTDDDVPPTPAWCPLRTRPTMVRASEALTP
jgi:hypothetical protein